MTKNNSLTVIILTYNNQDIIERCLNSVSFAKEIVVIDESTDQTAKICQKFGAKVYTNALNHDWSAQRNFALTKATCEWVLFVDSDEVVSPQLAKEIVAAIEKPSNVNGYYLSRLDNFLGTTLKHGEAGSVRLLRLAKKDSGRWERKVHEVWKIQGEVGSLQNSLIHYPHPSVLEFGLDVNRYTDIDAKEMIKTRKFHYWQVVVYPLAKFMLNYFVRLGFLDGFAGFVMAFMMSLHSLIVRIKIYDLFSSSHTTR